MQSKLPITKTDNLKNSVVLITGAGGTIGSELVRRIAASTIVAIDISEYAIYKLQRELGNRNVHCIVGDISDSKIVDMIFSKYRIDYVFNAAAYKHVDTLEDDNNSYSVIKNNVLSVINLCRHASEFKSLIHISSDKAVNPANTMGYTKLWGERIVQHYASRSKNSFKIVRFGNIYNSSGSFVETLNWQISAGLPITITDPQMKRYFMTVQDAVSLITAAADFNSATYILEMGTELPITALVPAGYPTTTIGIRPGEKLVEDIVFDYEVLENTTTPMIKKVQWKPVPMIDNIIDLMTELRKDKLCLPRLTEIITTTTIL